MYHIAFIEKLFLETFQHLIIQRNDSEIKLTEEKCCFFLLLFKRILLL